jgi:hypothetical protein
LHVVGSLDLDFYINTAGKLKLHQCVYCLGGTVVNVDKALVRTYLELFPGLLVHVG